MDAPYATLCFGNIELKKDRTVVVTALSDVGMKVLLDLLSPLNLGTPRLQRDAVPRLEKPARKSPRGKHWRKP